MELYLDWRIAIGGGSIRLTNILLISNGMSAKLPYRSTIIMLSHHIYPNGLDGLGWSNSGKQDLASINY